MILIVDNLISDEEINYCKKKFLDCDFPYEHLGRKFLDIQTSLKNDYTIKNICHKILIQARSLNENIDIDWAQLVFWPTNTNHNMHIDETSKNTVLSSVLYLNNNFRGGETFFSDGTVVCPKPGRVLFFDGLKYYHGVNPISLGERMSLNIWYKNKG